MSEITTKRKRTQNTSQEQYEIYLNYMEKDEIFRSSMLNPSLNPDYLKIKWNDLALQLNAIGTGPALTGNQWKKRFMDWKYAIKSKSRKIAKHAKKTKLGPKQVLEISATEERGLVVWDKVTAPGSDIPKCEAINPEVIIDVPEENEDNFNFDKYNEEEEEEEESRRLSETNSKLRVKPLSVLTKPSIQSNLTSNVVSVELNKTLKEFSDNYNELERQKLALEHEKFKFEVAKFKFLNKDFNF